MRKHNWKGSAKGLLLAVPLFVAGVWLACPSRPTAVEKQHASATSERPSTLVGQQSPSGSLTVARSQPPAAAGAAPIIDRVTIDQSVACRNEPLTIEVLAHAANGDNAGLVTLIDGRPGNPGVVSFVSSGDWAVPVLVYDRARHGEPARRELNVKVRECDAQQQWLEVQARPLPKSSAHGFVARLPEVLSNDSKLQQALRDATLSWDFGDGTSVRAGASTSHRYPDAVAASAMRTFMVRVEANVGGRLLRGKTTVSSSSEYLANKQRGAITPEVRVGETRRNAEGYSATLQVIHFEPAPLRLDTAEVSFTGCGVVGADASAPAPVSGPAERYLDRTELAQGRSNVELRLRASAVPERTCLAQLTFSGRAQDGEAVSMTAHLRFTPSGAEQAFERNTDAARSRTLTRALALLGRDLRDGAVVSDDELAILRQRGELKEDGQ
jgi:hypothetical protein